MGCSIWINKNKGIKLQGGAHPVMWMLVYHLHEKYFGISTIDPPKWNFVDCESQLGLAFSISRGHHGAPHTHPCGWSSRKAPCESLRLAHRLRSVTLSLPTSDPEVMEALNGAFRRNYMDKYVCFYGLRWMNMDEYDWIWVKHGDKY